MFETLNAILGNDMLRATLLIGSGALLAYTVRPLPSAIDTFASSNLLKFGALFIFGAAVMGELHLSRFMMLLFATLLVMILFEYLRQADKGLSVSETAVETAKEFMWGDDPTASYPAATPYADPRMGIPQYLPNGTTPAVSYNGHAGGVSNTGDYRYEKLSNPMEDAYDSIRDWSNQGIQAVSGVGAELAASAGLKNEHAFNPISTVRDVTQQGVGMAINVGSDILSTVKGDEQFVDLFNPLDVVFAAPIGMSQAVKVYDEHMKPKENMRVCVANKCWTVGK